MTEPVRPPTSTPTLRARLGEAGLLASGVALMGAVPSALRAAAGGAPFGGVLVVVAALLVAPVALSVGLVRGAARGFRAVAGHDVATTRGTLAAWAALSVACWTLLGALLVANTHHRALAGVTFAVVGLAVATACAVLAVRLSAIGEGYAARRGAQGAVVWAGRVLVGLGALAALAPVILAGEGAALAARGAILDALLVAAAVSVISGVELTGLARRLAGTLGVAAALLLAAVGFARLESSPALAGAVLRSGGLGAPILAALQAWSDRDRDGSGAHFGGGDCDEGDPGRHPRAVEVLDNAVDEDCDGHAARSEVATPVLSRAVPLAALPAAPSPSPPPTGRRPVEPVDIVLVTLDTVRADHTGPYGYTRKTTPRLDALAREAVVFERAYAVGSDTRDALAPLATGRTLADSLRDDRRWPTLLGDNDTVAERLARAGYACAAVVSFTWLSEARGFAQGFDRFDASPHELAHPERERTGPLAVARAVALYRELAAGDAPLYLWVHLFDPHAKYLRHEGLDLGGGAMGRYDGEIAFTDRHLGVLLDAVAGGPRAGRTAILVHGSHGEAFEEHEQLGHGFELYDEEIRVPLVLRLPWVAPRRHGGEAVSTLDVAATVIDLARADADGVDGRSLAARVEEGGAPPRGPIFASAPRRAAVIEWPLKLIRLERKRERFLLFDLEKDPREREDLSARRREDVERLRALLPPSRRRG